MVKSSPLPNTIITTFLTQTSHRYSRRLKTEDELDLKDWKIHVNGMLKSSSVWYVDRLHLASTTVTTVTEKVHSPL